jgi:hypothetical protein
MPYPEGRAHSSFLIKVFIVWLHQPYYELYTVWVYGLKLVPDYFIAPFVNAFHCSIFSHIRMQNLVPRIVLAYTGPADTLLQI